MMPSFCRHSPTLLRISAGVAKYDANGLRPLSPDGEKIMSEDITTVYGKVNRDMLNELQQSFDTGKLLETVDFIWFWSALTFRRS